MPICSIQGCALPHKARGYCNRHYRRLLANGDASDGALRRRLNGTGWKQSGYLYILHNAGNAGQCMFWLWRRHWAADSRAMNKFITSMK
jgi:hypothetical protein